MSLSWELMSLCVVTCTTWAGAEQAGAKRAGTWSAFMFCVLCVLCVPAHCYFRFSGVPSSWASSLQSQSHWISSWSFLSLGGRLERHTSGEGWIRTWHLTGCHNICASYLTTTTFVSRVRLSLEQPSSSDVTQKCGPRPAACCKAWLMCPLSYIYPI